MWTRKGGKITASVHINNDAFLVYHDGAAYIGISLPENRHKAKTNKKKQTL